MNSCAAKSFSYAKFSRPKTRTYYCISVSFDVSSACSLEKSLIKFFSVLNFLCRAGSAPACIAPIQKRAGQFKWLLKFVIIAAKEVLHFLCKKLNYQKACKSWFEKSFRQRKHQRACMCTKDMYDVVGSSSALPENFWFPFLCLSFFLKCIVNLLLQILKLVENAKIEMRRFQ